MADTRLVFVFASEGLPKERTAAREQIWARTAELLLPILGKLCTRFNPASEAWGNLIPQPFGVVFGDEDPAKFLTLYLAARRAQNEAVNFHVDSALKKIDPGQMYRMDHTLIVPVTLDGSDPELAAHLMWHISLQSGTILPDCGAYHVFLHKALVSEKEERRIIGNAAGYALCAVTVEVAEGKNEA